MASDDITQTKRRAIGVVIRFSPELHARLKALCDRRGTSMQRFVMRLIEQRLREKGRAA